MKYEDMKFEADILFKEYEFLFCPDFKEGYQAFKSWSEFLNIFSEHYSDLAVKPLYVMPASTPNDLNTEESPDLFVDVSQFIVIPWDELENYI